MPGRGRVGVTKGQVKAFRGTLIALVALAVLVGAWWFVRPTEMNPKSP